MHNKNTLDELLRQQFKHDTELASVDLPDFHTVLLRSKIVSMMGAMATRQSKATRAAHVTALIAQWLLIFLFLLAVASFIPTLGGATDAAKIIALGSVLVIWLMDRFE